MDYYKYYFAASSYSQDGNLPLKIEIFIELLLPRGKGYKLQQFQVIL